MALTAQEIRAIRQRATYFNPNRWINPQTGERTPAGVLFSYRGMLTVERDANGSYRPLWRYEQDAYVRGWEDFLDAMRIPNSRHWSQRQTAYLQMLGRLGAQVMSRLPG